MHSSSVAAYYDANTQPFYLDRWHPEDIHFGLFPRGCDATDHYVAVKRMTDAIVRPAVIRPHEMVVDAGCGVGGAALDIACDTGAKVLGLTISPVQVALAGGRSRDACLSDRVRFERADCSRALPCDNASIDVVVTIEAACHFDDKPNFLRECRRVLRPGGRLVGSDWMASAGLSECEYRETLQPVCDSWRLAGLESRSAWERMLGAAGFEVRECVDLADDVIPNATILARSKLDLMLECVNGGHSAAIAALWRDQYETLVRAWFERRFTIGRFFAVAV